MYTAVCCVIRFASNTTATYGKQSFCLRTEIYLWKLLHKVARNSYILLHHSILTTYHTATCLLPYSGKIWQALNLWNSPNFRFYAIVDFLICWFFNLELLYIISETYDVALLTSHFERDESPHVCLVDSTNLSSLVKYLYITITAALFFT